MRNFALARRLLEGSDGRLRAALAVAVAGSALLVAGAFLDVVEGARPAYRAWPLLVLLAVLPVAVAIGFAVRGRQGGTAGVLIGAGVVAVGRAVLDAQFVADTSLAARPELAVPAPYEAAPAWSGLSVLLAGHLLTAVAGFLALGASNRLSDDTAVPVRFRQPLLFAATLTAVLFSLGLVLAPFTSDDANLIGRSPLDGPPTVLAGALLLVASVPLAAALAVTAQSWQLATGLLLGLAAAGVAVVLPGLVAGLVVPWLHLGAGPFIALLGLAGLLVVTAVPVNRLVDDGRAQALPRQVRLPRQRWLFLATGALAVAAGGCAVAAAGAPLVTATETRSVLPNPSQWPLLPAGVVVGLLGLAMFVPAAAAVVRPALSVAWVAVLMAGAGALELPLAVADLPIETETGAGVVLIGFALVASLLVVGCSLVAGVIEREDVDRTAVGPSVMWPAAITGVLAVGTFGMPVVTAPRYQGSGLFWAFDISFGGVLAAFVAVLGVVAIVGRSRPSQAVALLVGAMLLVGVRLMETQVVSSRVADSTVRIGAWFGVGCLVALGAAVVVVCLSWRKSARP